MNNPLFADETPKLSEKAARSLAHSALLGIWTCCGWLALICGTLLVGTDCTLVIHDDGLVVGTFAFYGLWLCQFVAVCWIGYRINSPILTGCVFLLQLIPMLSLLGLWLMISSAKRKLAVDQLRLTSFGINREDWNAFLRRWAAVQDKCKNCGEPLAIVAIICPMCGTNCLRR